MIELLENGNLIIPQRYEENGTMGDGFIEIKKGDPKYEEYLSQYYHDLEIEEIQKKILNNEDINKKNK